MSWIISVVNNQPVISLTVESQAALQAQQAATEAESSEQAASLSAVAAELSAAASEVSNQEAQTAASSIIQNTANIPTSMLSSGNNDFVINASIIATAGGTFTNGSLISWGILLPNSDHEYSFYRSIKGLVSQGLEIRYPKVKNVLSSIMTGDEEFRKYGVQFGSTTGTQASTFFATRLVPNGFQLRGNGTNWTASGLFSSSYSLNTINGSGLTSLNLNSTTTGFDATVALVTYTGRNNYRIERAYSGLGGTAGFGFYLVDNTTNSRITTLPTTDDYIHISNWGVGQIAVPLYNWSLSAPSTGNGFMLNNNFWTIGIFELWMKAFPISSTKMKVIWQPKSGVTTYKLKRSTAYTVDANGDYVLTAPTLIYSGALYEYIEEGLTPDTMYYYQLLDQLDVEITQFNSKTKS